MYFKNVSKPSVCLYFQTRGFQLSSKFHQKFKDQMISEIFQTDQTQIFRHVSIFHMSVIWLQKIERLKGELHLLDADHKQKNKHTFFVDSKKEGKYCWIMDNYVDWHEPAPLFFWACYLKSWLLDFYSVSPVKSFDLATHLKTAPELVDRVYNRPTLETLETKKIQGAVDPRSIQVCAHLYWFKLKNVSKCIIIKIGFVS